MLSVFNRNRCRLGRSGTTTLEFSLIGGAFFLLIFGGMDLGRYYITLHSLHTVLGGAVRAAIINPTLTGCTAPAALVAAQAPFLQPSLLSLCVTRATSSGVTTISVTASYNFNFVVPIWSSSSGTLSDTTTLSY